MDSVILLILSILFISVFLCFGFIYLIKRFVTVRNDISYIENHHNPEKLIEEYKKILQKNPDNYGIKYRLAQVEEHIGLLADARETYLSLIDIPNIMDNVDNFFIYSKAEDISIRLNEKEEAFRYLIYLNNLDPKNREYALRIGIILVKEGYPQFAKIYLDRFITDSNDFDLMKTLTFIYYKLKEYKKAVMCLERMYKLLPANSDDKSDIENLLLNMYIMAEENFQAKSFAEFILGRKSSFESVFRIFRIYLFVLYKLNDREKFIKYYEKAVHHYYLNNVTESNVNVVLDLGFYSYFLDDIENSMKYFIAVKDSGILKSGDSGDIDKAIEYLQKMETMDTDYKKLEKSRTSKLQRKEIVIRYQDYITDEEKNWWDVTISRWESSIANDDYVNTFVKVQHTFDVERVLKEESVDIRENQDSQKYPVRRLFEIDRIYEISFKVFTNACQNIVKSKLRYFIQQEIIPSGKYMQDGDGIDYLAYPYKGSRNDLTLIAFRRWKSETVGELALRDFLISVHESGAKNGILFIPVELSKAAYGYAANNEILRVYSKWEFNNFLRGEKL